MTSGISCECPEQWRASSVNEAVASTAIGFTKPSSRNGTFHRSTALDHEPEKSSHQHRRHDSKVGGPHKIASASSAREIAPESSRPLSWLNIDSELLEETSTRLKSQTAAYSSRRHSWSTAESRSSSETGSLRAEEPIIRPSRPLSWLNIEHCSSQGGERTGTRQKQDHRTTPRSAPTLKRDARRESRPGAPGLIRAQGDDKLTALPPMPEDEDPWSPLPLELAPLSVRRRSSTKPHHSLASLSSLDSLLRFREEKEEWKRLSMIEQEPPVVRHLPSQLEVVVSKGDNLAPGSPSSSYNRSPSRKSLSKTESHHSACQHRGGRHPTRVFRHFVGEMGFCFTIAMTQFLAEYLISGFAIELAKLSFLTDEIDSTATHRPSSMGIFWPASLLSLVLSAMLLIFARLSDMYGGYSAFMFGVAWLVVWTLIPGLIRSAVMLDVSRAMQGLAIAAFMPSTFALVGSIYPEGRRKNTVLGLYAGCAPLGFFGGSFVAAALSEDPSRWYFWIAAALAGLTFVTAFLTVPADRTERRTLGLQMDWIGAGLITSGLLLVSYALSVEPYAITTHSTASGFGSSIVYGPLVAGVVALAAAFWYEGWQSTCPLLPFEFFTPSSVKAFSLACLCFYASYGAWLYNSADYFESLTGAAGGVVTSGITLAIWYLPTAIGGVLLCVVGGSLLHIIPITVLLLVSGIAWVAAPLMLALAPLPLEYWKFVMPSMLCATAGLDLTYTLSIVFLSGIQPLKFQGLTGAVCSILVNLAMSLALSVSEIVSSQAGYSISPSESSKKPSSSEMRTQRRQGLQAAFIYSAVSAGVGLAICILWVRIPRFVLKRQIEDVEQARDICSAATPVLQSEKKHEGDA